MAENENTTIQGEEIPDYAAQNYRALVADPERNLTYKKLAKQAEANNDPALAAWARREAANSGKDVTPTSAAPQSIEQAKREADKAAQDAGDETHVKTPEETPQVDATDAPGTTPPTGVPVDYNQHTVDELKELVRDRGIDATGLNLKADYVAALEKADEAGK